MGKPGEDPRREDPRRTHRRDQREAQAEDEAREAAAFYRTLRARGVPAPAAQGMAEAWIAGRTGLFDDGGPGLSDTGREPWQTDGD